MAGSSGQIPGLFTPKEDNPSHCPLCHTPVAGSDGLQLHYLTSCESYDRLSNEQPRPKHMASPSQQRNTFEEVSPTVPSPTPPPAENVGMANRGVPSSSSGSSSTVQFMWQPLTDISYPEITLLASFEAGSVPLRMDSDGRHYASASVAVPNGTYEGQLVIGDSFVYPVKKFTVTSSNDIIVLQFDVEQGRELSGNDDVTLGQYGTGTMQSNPSYSEGGSSFNNPAYTGYSKGRVDRSNGDSFGTNYDWKSSGLHNTSYTSPVNTTTVTTQPTRGSRYTTTTTTSVNSLSTTTRPRTTPLNTLSFGTDMTSDPFLPTTTSQSDIPSRRTPPPKTTQASTRPPMSADLPRTRTTTKPPTSGSSGKTKATTSTSKTELLPRTQTSGRPPTEDLPPLETPSPSFDNPLPTTSRLEDSSRRKSREPVRSVSEFNVGELKRGEVPTDMSVYQLLLQTVTNERDELKQSLERVNAHWEGRVKRLEAQLEGRRIDSSTTETDHTQALREAQGEINHLQREIDTLKQERASNPPASGDLDRELQEAKDMNTALEQQLMEYADTIKDQSKYIQQTVSQRGSMGGQQLTQLSEFSKMHQMEYAEALAELKTKITTTENTIANLETINARLAADIADCRTLNERFVQEMKRKDEEIQMLRMSRGLSQSHLDLELATMREKVIGYQQEFENMAPLKNEVEHLRALTAQQDEEIKKLTEDNNDLTTQFQTLLENSGRTDPETARKAAEYDVLIERYHDLQRTRISLENELQPLREERAKILRENAQLREGTNPESYKKMAVEYQTLKARSKELEDALAVHEDTNRAMQTKLNEATNPDMLNTIQSRMNRYKVERDQARKNLETVEQQLAVTEAGRNEALEKMQETTEQSERVIIEYQQNVAKLSEELAHAKENMVRYREKRNQAKKIAKDMEKKVANWQDLVTKSSRLTSSDHDDPSDRAYSSPYPTSDQTGSPTSDYHPSVYSDVQGDDSKIAELQSSLSSLSMEPSKSSRKRTSGSTRAKQYSETSSTSIEFVDVKTKEGIKVMSIGRSRGTLNAKTKPRVVIKRGEEFEQGTLMFVGEVNGKELAGIKMDCRVSKPTSGSATSSSGDNHDGTYNRDGRMYFKCPMGYGIYVPLSKVFVEMESAYV